MEAGTMAEISDGRAVCLSGQWAGWEFQRHPDGQYVSVRKLRLISPTEAAGPLAEIFGKLDQ